jgi:hypothetical protein
VGYELHITRSGEWIDADQHPITVAEWESFAGAHPNLAQDGSIGWKDIGTQTVYSFTCEDGTQALLSWRNDHVYVWGEFPDRVAALAALAAQLHARLVGDDEEEYLPDGSWVHWTEPRAPITPPAG